MRFMGFWLLSTLLLSTSVLQASEVNGSEKAQTDAMEPAALGSAQELISGFTGGAPAQSPAVTLREGIPHLLFQDAASRVVYRSPSATLLADEGVSKTGGGYFGVHDLPEGVFLTWWQKQDDAGKHLYVRRVFEQQRDEDSDAALGPAIKVNARNGVLPTYRMLSDGDGRLAIIYHDERVPRYGVYINVSLDGGETWMEEDMRLDGPANRRVLAAEPQLVFSGGRLVATWRESGVAGTDGTRFMVRRSDPTLREWEEPQEIASFARGFFTSDILVDVDGVLVALGYHLQEKQGLFGFRSLDGGVEWEAVAPLPGTEGLLEVSQTVAKAHDGVVHLAFTWRLDGRNEVGRRHTFRVGAGRFDAQEGAWLGELERLDVDKVPDLPRAWFPALAVTDSGILVAAWEDRREIRPNIYLSRSTDGGESWDAPVTVEPVGSADRRHPVLRTEGDEVALFYQELTGRRQEQRSFHWVRLGTDAELLEQVASAPLPGEAASAERLTERAIGFWSLRQEGNHAAVYDFLIPSYRSSVTREAFAANQGKIEYLEHELLGADVSGRIGATLSRVKATVPDMRIEGEAFQMEPRDDQVAQEWVWVDGDWFVVLGGGGHRGGAGY